MLLCYFCLIAPRLSRLAKITMSSKLRYLRTKTHQIHSKALLKHQANNKPCKKSIWVFTLLSLLWILEMIQWPRNKLMLSSRIWGTWKRTWPLKLPKTLVMTNYQISWKLSAGRCQNWRLSYVSFSTVSLVTQSCKECFTIWPPLSPLESPMNNSWRITWRL